MTQSETLKSEGGTERNETQILQEIRGIIDSINQRGFKYRLGMNNLVAKFGNELASQGVELRRCKLWHFLIGSDVPESNTPYFDTPDHTIENFIRSIPTVIDEYVKEKEK